MQNHSFLFRDVTLILFTLFTPTAQATADSIMKKEWLDNQSRAWELFPAVPYTIALPLRKPKPNIAVFGYLPYWNIGKPTLVLHFDRLDVIAYFGARLLSDGTLTDLHHWGQPVINDLIADAHAFGTKVVLTVTNFDSSSISTFLSSSQAQAKAISEITAALVSHGADGVNVDFEGLPKANKAAFVAFIAALKSALDSALGTSHVSVATPAVDWSGAYDYDLLAQSCDALFIMGYDYHWRNGPPGPVSPLAPSEMWGKYSLAWTIEDYIQWGGTENLPRFILGLPLYGLDWPTAGPQVPGASQGSAEARFYARCQQDFATCGMQWDAASSSPYCVYQAETWHQLWCENRQSLALKYALIAESRLGGVGFWALGYEETLTEVWEELDAHFPLSPQPDDLGPEQAEHTVSEDVVLFDVAQDSFITELQPADVHEQTESKELQNLLDVTAEENIGEEAQGRLPDSRTPNQLPHCASGCAVSARPFPQLSWLGLFLCCVFMYCCYRATRFLKGKTKCSETF